MLFLRTGLPGSGKTLNTIKEIDLEHAADPNNPELRLHKDPDDPALPPRTIYYHGIPELKTDQLKSRWVEWETPDLWYMLPDGCVIVIDEAQGTFGTDIRGRVEKVTRFEKHRHHGWDVHIITQHPSLICSPVRKLVGKHINFIRPYGRTKGIFRHEYEMCIDKPESRSNFKMAQESKIEFDKHYFGLYKSSTVHTHKKVTPSYYKLIPLFLAVVILPILLLGFGFWYVMKSKTSDSEALMHTETQSNVLESKRSVPLPATAGSTASGRAVQPVQEYVEQYKPRIADVESSAPRYDETNKARDFPRPTCMASTDVRMLLTAKSRGLSTGSFNGEDTVCQCYSQQATRMTTSFDFCMSVVQNGYFDDTKQQPAYATPAGLSSTRSLESRDGPQRGLAAVDQSAQPQKVSRFNIIPDTSRTQRSIK
ncbi:zonular occludens toxin domain-containing protein [Pseudomonas amygdali]|uniref:zonular occludens toxin domain-containing protein n=1 Tax=Pseudomonas amygdali TaxID=47877 RepID=UPI000CD03C54|nr:zonular occludens toxin domain-containing protein [Pseudomonas amygdali]POD06708.1 zonular occludens toxin [Pseudomonas amygdali pv. morsprunorum]POD48945.1 zonular occludens toxin [Pseudomonas amygdali pv. morsprunorum]POD54240.1 zonular occludens toxin [Pseudomonas amygdali pv. morsprunorum]POY77243.1 zonular occludens toxin [Pseudomonas amygdali pv. morsprunorum]